MIHEAVRIIREEEPTRLSSFDKVFRGDIETIIAKALQKDRTHRYQSAAHLADDIGRYVAGLPVVAADGAVLGFLAERDIVATVDRHAGGIRHLSVGDVMRRPAPVCGVDDTLHEVMARMTRDRLRHIVVVDAGRIAGLISVGDLVKHRLEELETEANVLRDYVAAQRALH